MSFQTASGYAGDLIPAEAFRLLSGSEPSVMIDVRTKAEWAFVGAPDLSGLGKEPLFLEWQSYPLMQRDAQFADRLSALLADVGAKRGSSLLFLCRSGARSREAAIAMTGAGWSPCYNIAEGFEGPLDPSGHRNSVGGWRAGRLPWKQT
jgi:rhodanese-related sulfurtransferase